MIDTKRTGRNIASIRRRMGWTQEKLACLLNVTHQAVSKWENGSAFPDIATLYALSRLFHVSMEELLTGAPAEPDSPSDSSNTKSKPEPNETAETPPPPLSATPDLAAFTEPLDGDQIVSLAPFLSRNALDGLIEALTVPLDGDQIVSLAPFLSRNALDGLIEVLTEPLDGDQIVSLAPFLSRNALDGLIEALTVPLDGDQIVSLAPFLSRNALDEPSSTSESSPAFPSPDAPFPEAAFERQFEEAFRAQFGRSYEDQFIYKHFKQNDGRRAEESAETDRRTEIHSFATPKELADQITAQLYTSCDAADPMLRRIDEIHKAFCTLNDAALNEFADFLNHHIGFDWLEELAEFRENEHPAEEPEP